MNEEALTYDRRIFADNLLRLMKARREKQVDIARLLGVSKSTVSGYCAATQMPRMDKIEQLAHHFGVSRAELIGTDAPPQDPPEAAPPSPVQEIYEILNADGRAEFLRYGRYLARQPEYLAAETPPRRIPRKPRSAMPRATPRARQYPKPVRGTVAPAPHSSTRGRYSPSPPRATPATT